MRSAEWIKVLQNARAIRRGDMPVDRARLARDYVRTQRRYRRLGGRAGSETILGRAVSAPDYATFAMLVEETFAYEQYRFRPSRPAPVVIDAGANIGVATLYFALVAPGARITAIEPDPETAATLRDNLARAGLDGVTVVEAALAAEEGEIALYRDPNKPASVLTTTTPGMFPAATTVRALPLSRLIEDDTDFVKIDVEGAEIDIVEELASSGRLRSIRELAVEHGHHAPDTGVDRLSRLLRTFEDNGFGYQLSAPPPRPMQRARAQNILVYAYRID